MNEPRSIDGIDKQLLGVLQDQFPVEPRPFASIADKLSLTGAEVLRRVRDLKDRKVIRRIGAVFDQKALGYTSVLATMTVPGDEVEKVASYVSTFSEVTHNYSRKHKFNVWFTITGSSDRKITEVVRAIEHFAGLPVYLLRARRTFKIRAVFEL